MSHHSIFSLQKIITKASLSMATPAEAENGPYDVNFCFPVRELENSRVKLTPFTVSCSYSMNRNEGYDVIVDSHLHMQSYSSKATQTIRSSSNTSLSVLMTPCLT